MKDKKVSNATAKLQEKCLLETAKDYVEADKLWNKFKNNKNFNLFIGMYKIKGAKTAKAFASIQSCQIDVIEFILLWFRKFSNAKTGLYVYHYPDRKKEVQEYWENRIKADSYYYYATFDPEKLQSKECNTYKYGSVRIQINDTRLKRKLDYWLTKFNDVCKQIIQSKVA